MNAIIFSKDRAMQLDCLLRSMEEYCPFFDIQVLFDYSNEMYRDAYFQCMDEHDAEWYVEQNFHEDVQMLIMPGWNCLLVDDCVFYREVDELMLDEMASEVDVISLRLGNDIAKHRNYKGSIDGNIYTYETLLKLRYKKFRDPNFMEARLVNICNNHTMGWFNRGHLKGIPANKVSINSTCADMGISTALLNDLYLEGRRIDYNSMDFTGNDVHKEINILEHLI